jgi:spore maturation protein CgeB
MENGRGEYQAELVRLEDGRTDVRVQLPGGKSWSMWGRRGAAREEELAESVPEGRLPVLLGAGLGLCLDILSQRGPVAVVDAETPIQQAVGARERLEDREGLLWLDERDPERAMELLHAWRDEHGGQELAPLSIPLYRRLDPELYPALEARMSKREDHDGEALFWRKARYAKFRGDAARVLLLSSPYFLYREIREALGRLGAEVRELDIGSEETIRPGFVEELLRHVLDFRPDFALTVNHLGVDRDGALAGLLERLSLPLASWFVDSPHLILHRYAGQASGAAAVFTWDADAVGPLTARGFPLVRYLPLATDERVFRPGLRPLNASLRAEAGFVGDSMVSKVAERLEQADPSGALKRDFRELARDFAEAPEASPADFLRRAHPEHAAAFEALPTVERQLSYEALLTWEATRVYRSRCVLGLAGFDAVVAGDVHWREILKDSSIRLEPPLDYYADLPRFYPGITVNLNCTSRQMKAAVNQRVFDVPACGGFLLTDRQAQLERLFVAGEEVAVYDDPEEIPELVRFYRDNHAERRRIVEAARSRVLAEHTYVRRLQQLLDAMRSHFG